VVVNVDQGQAVRAGVTLIPLPANTTLAAGQNVLVRLEPGTERVFIQPSPVPAESAAPRPTLFDVLARVLDGLPGINRASAETAARLIPPQLPISRPALQALFSLLSSDANLGTHFSRVVSWISRAVQAGVVAPDVARQVEQLLGPRDGARADRYAAALRSAAGHAGRSLEAALVSDDPLSDVRLLLASLRNDLKLQEFLRSDGTLRAFSNAAEAIGERLSAGSLQNLRGLDMPYLYMEIPFPPGNPLQHVRIHAHLDDERRNGRGATRSDRVSLDVSTTRLGDLWIDLRTTGETCRCQLDAVTQSTRAAIVAAQDDLAEHLRATGFRDVHVIAGEWDGDRWTRTASLFQSTGAIDIEA
jgi:hypothetical protein